MKPVLGTPGLQVTWTPRTTSTCPGPASYLPTSRDDVGTAPAGKVALDYQRSPQPQTLTALGDQLDRTGAGSTQAGSRMAGLLDTH